MSTKPEIKKLIIPLGGVEVTCYGDHEEDEDTIHGTVVLLGVSHHAQFIRVTEDGDGVQVPTRDPHERYADMQRIYDVNYQTVQIPGFEGNWVLLIHPGED
jgi:hypothetical protein